ncbi:hypothetical protein DMY04_23125 [Enterobacter hormaechei subsp. steigerwaltii]|nr:hypothetical protein DMY04_23125 [Enterobacter hormaechei subsp. steigerwaltii]
MNQNPFSIYDFLGYLIPGGLFLYLLYFCGITLDWDVIIQLKKTAIAQESSLSLLGYSSIVILAYIIGHAIAICSAFLGRVRISTLRNENETFSQLNSITYIGVFLRLVTYSHLP